MVGLANSGGWSCFLNAALQGFKAFGVTVPALPPADQARTACGVVHQALEVVLNSQSGDRYDPVLIMDHLRALDVAEFPLGVQGDPHSVLLRLVELV
eukprot:CAMPEP_0118946054 /NCGR_PEP_ID=MMETSP1169-20130426/43496_1 /TAXON_ID=36882 /ORGANISM="Pyramimonas obovata, Strain CCMP722" /LENGTH=96 /DNA_ID=CAMNT_0006891935 /DNA_START=27 /DNA_END=314 /DNA_ORIENTATION=+